MHVPTLKQRRGQIGNYLLMFDMQCTAYGIGTWH